MTVVDREEILGGVRVAYGASRLDAGANTLTVGAGELSTWTFSTGRRFPVVINAGRADEEHLYATGVAGDTLTGLIRGQDGTADQQHAVGFTVQHGLFAKHVDLLNEFLSLPTAAGQILVATGADEWGVGGAPAITDFTNARHDHLDNDDGGTLSTSAMPALVSSWLDYSAVPVATGGGFTLGDGTFAGRYKTVGKTVIFTVVLTYGLTTAGGSGRFQFPLPLAAANIAGMRTAVYFEVENATPGGAEAGYHGVGRIAAGATVIDFLHYASASAGSGYLGPTAPVAFAAGDVITVSGTYESV